MTKLSASLEGSVVVVTGPPGAGKSAAANHLVTMAARGVLLDGDGFFNSVKAGWVPPWLPESGTQNATVIDALGAAASRFARGGYLVIVDGIIGPWFLERFSAEITAPLHYVVVRPNRHAAFARAAARPPRPGDSSESVTKMYDEFESLGVYERCVIDNSMHLLDETVLDIAEGLERGRFRV